MQPEAKTARAISGSLLRLRSRNPFFATLVMFARIEASQHIPTAATDGRAIFLNEAFFLGLKPAEQDGLLIHEVLHAALLHVPRRGRRVAPLWNIAADIVVNGMIRAQRLTLPPRALYDRELEDLRVEEVYELLMQDLQRRLPDGWGDLLERPPADCSGADMSELSPDRRTALETYWQNALLQARYIAESKGQGSLPAGLLREIDASGRSQLDWRSYLWRFLVQTPNDFREFDRRFLSRRLYIETLEGESVQVLVCIDTSGSIGGEQLQTFAAELRGILGAYPHLRCQLFYADAALHGPYELEQSTALPAAVGGGGTDFRPFFEHVEEQRDQHAEAVCVYLTDGYGTFPEAPPRLPVLWVVTAGGRALESIPFGERVRLLVHA